MSAATASAYQRGLTGFVTIVRAYRSLLDESGKSLEFQRDKLAELVEFLGKDNEDFTFDLGLTVAELPSDYQIDGDGAELLSGIKEALRIEIQRLSALATEYHVDLADMKRGVATTFRLYYNLPAQTGGRYKNKNKKRNTKRRNKRTFKLFHRRN